MNVLSPLLMTTIFCLVLLAVIWHRHWALHSLNQAKVDATSLSLCHQSAHHLNEELKKSNLILFTIRVGMTAYALACKAKALAASLEGLYAPQMVLCNRHLANSSRLAKTLESFQAKLLNGTLPAVSWSRLHSLISENKLKLHDFREIDLPRIHFSNQLIQVHPTSPGFVRKPVTTTEESLETLFSAFGQKLEWPEELVADKSLSPQRRLHDSRKKTRFEAHFSYGLTHIPPGLKYQPPALYQPSIFEKKVSHGNFRSLTKSESYCYLTEIEEGREYEVKIDSPEL